ncbi:PREDICTED: POTE ankyrin domain family member B2-like [Mandrillus leucophaeus]|uniref:POTE ankyrin domain family member B2-like n=1 Tax=Mandrillus leucophaeus TaxID=9568 RepID=UPI0005F4A549|nr:PREDICTED: POTE ankyrin domain family member B2-like [Mandrillus leucophaeus]
MLTISSENSNPEQDLKLTSEEESQRLKGSENSQPEEISQEQEINKDCDREVEEVMKKHGSNHVRLPENLTNDATAGNGDDGLIPQSKSRTPESQQFPDTENEEYHSDEQNDTQKQVLEEQIAGMSQEEILTNKQEQMEVAEKEMNSEVSLSHKKEKDLLHENYLQIENAVERYFIKEEKKYEYRIANTERILVIIENTELLKGVEVELERVTKAGAEAGKVGEFPAWA